MPAYKSLAISTPSSLFPGDSYQLWNAEQPVIGTGGVSASERVAIVAKHGNPGGFAVDGFFAAAPGTFEIDVQVAQVDIDSQYQTCPNGLINSVDATNQTFHFDGSLVLATFVRLLMRARGNAVAVTAAIRRL